MQFWILQQNNVAQIRFMASIGDSWIHKVRDFLLWLFILAVDAVDVKETHMNYFTSQKPEGMNSFKEDFSGTVCNYECSHYHLDMVEESKKVSFGKGTIDSFYKG